MRPVAGRCDCENVADAEQDRSRIWRASEHRGKADPWGSGLFANTASLDDTICPIDFAENGQITSDVVGCAHPFVAAAD